MQNYLTLHPKLEMTFDEECKKEAEIFIEIISFLNEFGIPTKRINELKQQFESSHFSDLKQMKAQQPTKTLEETITLLKIIQGYTRAYPYMNVKILICKLFEIWDVISSKNQKARKQLMKRISFMKTDPKADQDVLDCLEGLKNEYEECSKVSNLFFYEIRALKELY